MRSVGNLCPNVAIERASGVLRQLWVATEFVNVSTLEPQTNEGAFASAGDDTNNSSWTIVAISSVQSSNGNGGARRIGFGFAAPVA